MKVMRCRFWRSLTALELVAVLCGCGAFRPSEAALLNDEQKKFLAMERSERIVVFSDADRRLALQKAGDIPQAMTYRPDEAAKVVVTLRELDAPMLPAALRVPQTAQKSSLDGGRVEVSAPPYIRTAWHEGTLYFCNFKLARNYELSEVSSESGKTLRKKSFVTEGDAPRLMAVDRIPNMRDLGGRTGLNGRRVRQGLVYRSAALNESAVPERIPVTEAMEDELAWRTPAKERIEAGIRTLEAIDPDAVEDCDFSDKWIVYAPGRGLTERDCLALTTLTSAPDELLGMRARFIQLNAANRFAFPVPSVYTPSVFVKKIVCPEAKTVRAGCGAGWFFRVYLNGKEMFDALEKGNGSPEQVPADNPMLLPLEKGENFLVIPLLSGETGWLFSFGAVSTSPETIRMRQLANLRRHARDLDFVHTGKKLPGKNRLTPAMQSYLADGLGIRTELDLRSDGECFGMQDSPAGTKVKWVHIPGAEYGGMESEAGRKAFAKAFRVFLNEKNYPVLFHCIAGQDRTGSLAFLLNALLGVDEEELYRDWEASGFWYGGADFSHRDIHSLVEMLNRHPGETLQKKAEDYVKSCGFSLTEIEKFRAIMLEEK